jgi:hypothetical protein
LGEAKPLFLLSRGEGEAIGSGSGLLISSSNCVVT